MILNYGSNVIVSEPRLMKPMTSFSVPLQMMMYIRHLRSILRVYLQRSKTLEALKIKKLYNQLVLSSEKALSYLKFMGTVPQEETKLWHFSPLTLFNLFDEETKTGTFELPEEV